MDKIEHWIAFAAPVLLITLAVGRTRALRGADPVPVLAVVVGAVFVVHAVVSELVQGAFYTRRTADPLDVVADVVGVAVGAGGAAVLLRTRRSRDST